MTLTLFHALKEWAVAVEALTSGTTILLMRKGGIRERKGRFSVEFDRVLLYPTHEHQQPHLLKPEYASRVKPVESGWHPQVVPIPAWAQITQVWQVGEPAIVEALMPYHIWNDRFVGERLRSQPHQPLYILLLRVYRLGNIAEIPHRREYGGCRSWIDLEESIAISEHDPVLNDDDYTRQVDRIREIADDNRLK
ncbi:MAG: DUF1802 family protein [Geitlerinemataceae cyanobacterium]